MNQRNSKLKSNLPKHNSSHHIPETIPFKTSHSQHYSYPLKQTAHAKSQRLRVDSVKQDNQLQELVKMFALHYSKVQRLFKMIDNQMTHLEAKLAQCFGQFNAIEWKINKKVHEFTQSSLLNQQLLKMNEQVEEKLTEMRKDYSELKKQRYISNLERKLQQLKQYVHRFEIEQYRNKFNRQAEVLFEDNIDKLESLVRRGRKDDSLQRNVYMQIIGELIAIVKDKGQIGQWMQTKIQENIELKIRLIKNNTKSIMQDFNIEDLPVEVHKPSEGEDEFR